MEYICKCKSLYKLELPILTLQLVFFVSPFVDAITGYLLGVGLFSTNSPFSPSQIFRFGITILLLIQLTSKQLSIALGMLISLIIVEIMAFINHNYIPGLLSGTITAVKLSFILLLYFVLKNYITNGILRTYISLINYLIKGAAIYAIITVISDMLGISFGSYGEGLGSKGLFASANGLGIFLGVASLYSLFMFKNYGDKIYIYLILLFSFVLIHIMSKAALLSVCLTFVLWFYYIDTKYKCLFLFGILLLISYFYQPIVEFIETAGEIVIYRWNNSGDIWSFLLSGRTMYLDYALGSFNISGLLIYRLLIGAGYFMSFRNPDLPNFWEESSSFLEAELIDTFFMYGLIGLTILIIIGIKSYASLNRNKNKYNMILKAILLMLLFHSAFAGHVLFNGMSVIALVSILVISFNNKYKNESSFSIS